MPRTIAEKLLGEAAGHPVRVGQTVISRVDRVLLQDGTAPRVLERLEALGLEQLTLARRTTLFIDHAAPPPTPEIACQQAELVARCHELGIRVSPGGNGISHQVMVETQACPGELIVGADSHTCTAGALGAAGLGTGSTDVACAVALGETWLVVPPTVKVELNGALGPGVVAKDAMLTLIHVLGASGANNLCLEFDGPGLSHLDQEERFVLANLTAEVGAKTGVMPTDAVTKAYLDARGRGGTFKAITSDEGAVYERYLKLDLDSQEPMVARPDHHDDAVVVTEVAGEPVDQVVIGSCTNGRVGDFAAAASVLEGRRVHPRTRLLLIPASRAVMEECFAAGHLPRLLDAGGTLVTPGCGPCVGIHQGTLGDGQVCLATQSRNWPGRMGSRTARIYLASPYTAAVTALRGEIADPREVIVGA